MLRRRKIDPEKCTLLELAYVRTGSMLKAARVSAFVVQWGIVRRELGRDPASIDEYAAWWKEHRATAFRHRAEFREVFPGLDHPGPVLDLIEQQQAQATEPLAWGGLATA